MKIVLSFFIIFFFSCSSSSQIDQNQNNTTSQQETKKSKNSDDELLSLLEGKKTEADQNTISKTDSSENTSQQISQPSNKDTINNNIKFEQTINNLEKEITNKNTTINQLSNKINDLENENIELKNKKTEIVVSSGSGQIISDEEYESHYKNAYELFQNRNYTEAIKIFENLIANNASHKLSANAQYWTGECNFALKNYKVAILDFEKVFTFSNANKHEDSQFKLAYSYYMLKDKTNAKIEFQRFLDKYPKKRNADRARKMMNE